MILRYTQPDWPEDTVFELWNRDGTPRALAVDDEVWGYLTRPAGIAPARKCSIVSVGSATVPARVTYPFSFSDFPTAGDYSLELEVKLNGYLSIICDLQGVEYLDGSGRSRIPSQFGGDVGEVVDGNLSALDRVSSPRPWIGDYCYQSTAGSTPFAESHGRVVTSSTLGHTPDEIGDDVWWGFSVYLPSAFVVPVGTFVSLGTWCPEGATTHGQGFGHYIYDLGGNNFKLAWGLLAGRRNGIEYEVQQSAGGGWGGNSTMNNFILPRSQWIHLVHRFHWQWEPTGDIEMYAKATLRDLAYTTLIDQHDIRTAENIGTVAPGGYRSAIGALIVDELITRTLCISRIVRGSSRRVVQEYLESAVVSDAGRTIRSIEPVPLYIRPPGVRGRR